MVQSLNVRIYLLVLKIQSEKINQLSFCFLSCGLSIFWERKGQHKILCGKLAPRPDVKTSPGDLVGLPALGLCVLGGVSFLWGDILFIMSNRKKYWKGAKHSDLLGFRHLVQKWSYFPFLELLIQSQACSFYIKTEFKKKNSWAVWKIYVV